MPKVVILKREVVWSADEKVIQISSDTIYPESNGRYRCAFCGEVWTRASFIEHFPGCKMGFLGEE